MAKQTINIGATANDKSGDPLRTAFSKTNSNFNELYALVGGTVAQLTEIAQDYAAPLLNHASHTGITFSYDDDNNKLIAVISNAIPSITGNADRYLYTNGSTISWSNVPPELPSILGQSGKYLYTNGTSVSWENVITAASSNTFTNKTINIQPGQGNVFQINSNSITLTTGSNSTMVLDTNPTINTLFIGDNSNLVIGGGTSTYYWAGSAGVVGDDLGGIYRNRVTASNTNSLFTFGANGTGNMSVQIEGSLFVGSALPSNNGGLNTGFPGWLVVESGGKFGGDINTLGGLIFDSSANGDITFANNATIAPSSNNLTINTVSGLTTKTWTFDNNGGLTLPDGSTVRPTESNSTVGGSLTVRAGDSQQQAAGSITLRAGDTLGSLGSANGGNFIARAGTTVSGNGGQAQLEGGTTVTGNGGDLLLYSGQAVTGNGGDIAILAGTTVTGAGGNVNIESGEAVTGDSGDITITARGTTTGAGGDISLTAGSTITGYGGDITLIAGDHVNTGAAGEPGVIKLRTVNLTVNKDWTFGNGTLTFPNNTVQTTAYPGITNEHSGSSVIVVGQITAVKDYLSVRLTNNSNTLDVEINYNPPTGSRSISVYKTHPTPTNLYSGDTTKAAGNTTWDLVDNLAIVGNSCSFIVTDHSFYKIYRVTVIADDLPATLVAGEAFCTIEQLK